MAKIDQLRQDIEALSNNQREWLGQIENAEGDDLTELRNKLDENTSRLNAAKDEVDQIVTHQNALARETQTAIELPRTGGGVEHFVPKNISQVLMAKIMETNEETVRNGLRALSGALIDIPDEIVANTITNAVQTTDVPSPNELETGIDIGEASSYLINHLTPVTGASALGLNWNEGSLTRSAGFRVAEGTPGTSYEPEYAQRTVVPAEFDIPSALSWFLQDQRPDARSAVLDDINRSYMHHASIEAGHGGNNLATIVGVANAAFTGGGRVQNEYLIATEAGNTDSERNANFAKAVVASSTTLSYQSGGPLRGFVGRGLYNRLTAERHAGGGNLLYKENGRLYIPGADNVIWTPIDTGLAAEANNVITAVLFAPDAKPEHLMGRVQLMISDEVNFHERETAFKLTGYSAPKFTNRWAYAQIIAKTS